MIIERQRRYVRQPVATAQLGYVPGLYLIPSEFPVGGCRSGANLKITNSIKLALTYKHPLPERWVLIWKATFVFWGVISNPLSFFIISENPSAVISFGIASFNPLSPASPDTHPSPLSTQGYKYASLPLFRIRNHKIAEMRICCIFCYIRY